VANLATRRSAPSAHLPVVALLAFDPGILRLAPLAGKGVGSHPANLRVRVFEQRDQRLGCLIVAVEVEVLATSAAHGCVRTAKASLHGLHCFGSRGDERPQRGALDVRGAERGDDFIE
jgi:hypothetical protein